MVKGAGLSRPRVVPPLGVPGLWYRRTSGLPRKVSDNFQRRKMRILSNRHNRVATLVFPTPGPTSTCAVLVLLPLSSSIPLFHTHLLKCGTITHIVTNPASESQLSNFGSLQRPNDKPVINPKRKLTTGKMRSKPKRIKRTTIITP